MNGINKDQRPLPDYTYEVEMLKRAGKRVCIMPHQGAWCNDCTQFLHWDILDQRKPYQVVEERRRNRNE